MSPNHETDLPLETNSTAQLIASLKHDGAVVDHVNCSTVASLAALMKQCKSENKALIAGKPFALPSDSIADIRYFLTLDGLDAVIEHFPSDQVISVQTGFKLSALQSYLEKTGQWFPVYSADPDRSLLDFINHGDAGPLEHAFGEARDLVLGITCFLGSGESIKCGGKVVKNVTGYDLVKMFCGSKGTLCIPTSAHLRLYAKPEASATLIISCQTIADAFRQAPMISRSGLPLSCVEIVDGKSLEQMVLDSPQLNQSALNDAASSKAAICVQIHGMPQVVADLKKDLYTLLPESKIGELDQSSESIFWSSLSANGQMDEGHWLTLCAPNRILQQICESASASTLKWSARTSRQKATFVFQDANKSDEFIEKIVRAALPKDSAPIAFARPADGFAYKAGQLPEGDQILLELKRRLKLEYDPAGILNPISRL